VFHAHNQSSIRQTKGFLRSRHDALRSTDRQKEGDPCALGFVPVKHKLNATRKVAAFAAGGRFGG
jgi:hypothetical protein